MAKLFKLLYQSDKDRENLIRITKNLIIDGNSAENGLPSNRPESGHQQPQGYLGRKVDYPIIKQNI